MDRLELRISGRVQGVGFRWHAREEALRLGLTGRVRNLADGSVQLVAEGPRVSLEALATWCGRGPVRARVDVCEAAWSEAAGAWNDFKVTG
ncbi:MAG: acylphosphatase [bacterium]|jgi:acylphosphatase|nr:acylphosphatase [bacterium]MBK7769117.1 acylphosphatase [bacterium]MBK9474002.1 acylphosphatase [bacterium]MBK9775726.1 acylphosphatase [bacterium]